MDPLTQFVLAIATPLLLLVLGGGLGAMAERRHERDLTDRERALASMPVDDIDVFRRGQNAGHGAKLVVSEVVMASDYLKTFLASLRTLVGGEVNSFARLLLRGRREVVLRLMEQAAADGCDALCNVRLTTAQIGRTMVAVQGSATAYAAGTRPGP